MKNIFKRVIVDFFERDIKNIFSRSYEIPLDSKKIVSLIGVRRSGKSFVLFEMINKLREKIPKENIIYLNFEDDRFYPLELKSLDLILESYYEMYPHKRDEKIYLFLDEIQEVEMWELYVRRIYDTLNIQIFITGSSAKLLSSEIATSLRGRTITYEIFPFSFKEYLEYKNIEINLHSSNSLSYIKNALASYLIDGGFAETIDTEPQISRKILSDYLELIVYKDIVERYNITNRSLLKHLNKYCFTNIATLVSFTKLYNDFKSQGFKLSKDTIFQYLSHLEDAYTIFTLPIYRNSIKEEQRNPKKIYAVDSGFKKIYDYAIGEDMSKLYENAVYLHLRRKTKNIYYYKQKQEVDFYAKLEDREILVNVSYDISNLQTREREINGLVEAMEYLNLKEAFLVTQSEESVVSVEDKTITILPLYKYMLDS
ncbi:MAG: ATP-binding protein [Campylobacterales bacterium]|nr:ATP-binding protein [Campylobacterales bacterium]